MSLLHCSLSTLVFSPSVVVLEVFFFLCNWHRFHYPPSSWSCVCSLKEYYSHFAEGSMAQNGLGPFVSPGLSPEVVIQYTILTPVNLQAHCGVTSTGRWVISCLVPECQAHFHCRPVLGLAALLDRTQAPACVPEGWCWQRALTLWLSGFVAMRRWPRAVRVRLGPAPRRVQVLTGRRAIGLPPSSQRRDEAGAPWSLGRERIKGVSLQSPRSRSSLLFFLDSPGRGEVPSRASFGFRSAADRGAGASLTAASLTLLPPFAFPACGPGRRREVPRMRAGPWCLL